MNTAPRQSPAAARPSGSALGPRQNIPLLMMQAFHYSRRAFDEAVGHHDLTASQLGLLVRIQHNPGISGAELSRQMFTTPQAVQLTLVSLERRGLVERSPDPDHGRIVRSTLTKKGHRLLDVCVADALAVEQRLCAPLTEGERAILTELLLRYINHSAPE